MSRKSNELININSQDVRLDIANWASREPYGILSDMETKINNRLFKKYKLRIKPCELKARILYYKNIYSIIRDNLPRYILPSKSGYTEPKYIKNKEIKDFLDKKFATEDKEILNVILNWVIEFEYLR